MYQIVFYVLLDQCTKSQVSKMFPSNTAKSKVKTRKLDKYHVYMATTGRYKKLAVPFMQRLLNLKPGVKLG